MIKKLLLILGCLLSFNVAAAAPTGSCTFNQTSGAAPLAVSFDCSAVTGGTKPYHNIQYVAYAGTSLGNWANGAVLGSKSIYSGPTGGFVYETAGTYTLQINRTNYAGEQSKQSQTITVSAFSGTTKCYYQSAPSGDCPNSGAETQAADWDAALAACAASNTQCLFQRGSTFTVDDQGTISGAFSNLTIGAYSTGARPVVTTASGNMPGNGAVRLVNASLTNIRVMDLDIRGAGSTDTGNCMTVQSPATKALFLRVTCSNVGGGLVIASGSSLTGSILQDNSFTYITKNGSSNGNGTFGAYSDSAILGNYVGDYHPATAEHGIRCQPCVRTAISQNTITNLGETGKSAVTVRGSTHTTGPTPDPSVDSQYIHIARNKITYNLALAYGLSFAPSSNSVNEWISDGIQEGNLHTTLGAGGGIVNSEVGGKGPFTIRNNIYDRSGSAGGVAVYVFYTSTAGSPVPDDIQIQNNTIYDSTTSGVFYGIELDTEPTNVIVTNLLAYAPAASSANLVYGGSYTAITNTSNSQAAGGSKADPFPSAPSTSVLTSFQCAGSAYCATGGTEVYPPTSSDIFSCGPTLATVASIHMGAVRPLSSSLCRGASGKQ